MHRGRNYPLDHRLRVYCGNVTYPRWFPLDGYNGLVQTFRSSDWSGPIIFNDQFLLTGWGYGDYIVSYEPAPITLDGKTVSCRYWFELAAAGFPLTGNIDLYVDGVQQIRSTPAFPGAGPQPGGYNETALFAAPTTPFKVQWSSINMQPVGY